MPPRVPLTGLVLMITGVALFSILNGVVKAQMEVFPVAQVIFFRNAFALVPLAFMLRGVRLPRATLPAHLGLALTFTLALACVFGSYARLPLADATAIGFFQPLMVALMTLALGLSRVARGEWVSIALGLGGVLILVQPSGQAGSVTGVMLALGGAAFAAAGMIQQRQLSLRDPTALIAFMTLALSALMVLPVLPFDWVTPTGPQLAGLVAMGLASGLCQFVTVRAAYHASAVMLAPINYTKMIWAILIGFLWFEEVPGLAVLAGTGVILISTLLSLRNGRQPSVRRS